MKGDPARTAGTVPYTLQASCIAPISNGRDVDVQQFCCGQGRVAPIATLSRRGDVWAFWALQRDLVGVANPGYLARGQRPAHTGLCPFGIEQRRDLGLRMELGPVRVRERRPANWFDELPTIF